MPQFLMRIRELILGGLCFELKEAIKTNRKLSDRVDIIENELAVANSYIKDLNYKIKNLASEHAELAREYNKSAIERAIGIRSATGL